MSDNEPKEYYCFVMMDRDELVLDENGGHAYWLTEQRARDVVLRLRRDAPTFDFSNYGLAHVTVTKTQFTATRDYTTYNINVLYSLASINK